MHDPVARVTPRTCLQRELRADRVHPLDRLAEALRRHADVLADLAAADPREKPVETVAPAPQRASLGPLERDQALPESASAKLCQLALDLRRGAVELEHERERASPTG